MIEVLKPGTKVLADGVGGVVQSVAIGYNDRVSYEIEWWNGRERKTHWFYEGEVLVDKVANAGECHKVGFVGGPKTKKETHPTKALVTASSIVANIDVPNRRCHLSIWDSLADKAMDCELVPLGRLSALLQYGEATIEGSMFMLEKQNR